jgi:hypothetical protein
MSLKTEMAMPKQKDTNSSILKMVMLLGPAVITVLIFLLLIVPNRDRFGEGGYLAMYWFFVPLCVYIITTLCALILQFTTCKTVVMDIIWLNTWQILLYVYGALGISEFTIIRAPVVSLIPYKGLKGINDILEIERLRKDEFIREKAISYWLFWGILIGQMNIIGRTTICPS